jgi:hypothetical protein
MEVASQDVLKYFAGLNKTIGGAVEFKPRRCVTHRQPIETFEEFLLHMKDTSKHEIVVSDEIQREKVLSSQLKRRW